MSESLPLRLAVLERYRHEKVVVTDTETRIAHINCRRLNPDRCDKVGAVFCGDAGLNSLLVLFVCHTMDCYLHELLFMSD
jgi:hypothetical protein